MSSSKNNPFSLEVWDPSKDSHLEGSFTPYPMETATFVNAQINWKETPEAYVAYLQIPGLKKDEVKVQVEENGKVLKISGERHIKKIEEKQSKWKWEYVEQSSGKFLRKFKLPENARADEIGLSVKNDVLTVTVCKGDRTIQIK